MSLPIYTSVEDIEALCGYLVTKPMGASVDEIKAVIDPKHLDNRRVSAMKQWGLIEEAGRGLKVTDLGRAASKDDGQGLAEALTHAIRNMPPYLAIIERAFHRREDSLTSAEIGSHWHDHFEDEISSSEKALNEQVVCFLRIAEGAGLGSLTVGRRGSPTRFEFSKDALNAMFGKQTLIDEFQKTEFPSEETIQEDTTEKIFDKEIVDNTQEQLDKTLGKGIFIAHGKNKKPLEQLKKILDQFRIPYKVATEEPNLLSPISQKVRDIMHQCNCSILIFTADEEFKDVDGNVVWRPSENVVYELGAAGFLYDNRIVIMKEHGVEFPANFRDLGYISFTKDKLDSEAMEVLKELIGFEIVKITT